MAFSSKQSLLLFFLLASYLATLAMSRPLAERIKLDEESSSCWESLFELQACTGEIILFFLNGETYLGHLCCDAIRTITQHCWPNMMDTLGFTDQEGDILEGYCDKATRVSPTLPSPPSLGPAKSFVKGD